MRVNGAMSSISLPAEVEPRQGLKALQRRDVPDAIVGGSEVSKEWEIGQRSEVDYLVAGQIEVVET